MAADLSAGLMFVLVAFCSVWLNVYGFKDGAPFDMCKYKGNAFHTEQYNRLYVRWIQPMEAFNIPSPYKLTAEKRTYRQYVNRTVNGKIKETPDMIKVTLSVIPGYDITNFKGFYIKAIPFNRSDEDPRAYGTFAVVDENGRFAVKNKNAETVLCYVLHWYQDTFPIGGVSHTSNSTKNEIIVYWFPPKKCDIGRVRFEATVVYEYSIYWSDVHSEIIEPEGFGKELYPACQYYRDPMGYFKKIQKNRKNKDGKIKNNRKNKDGQQSGKSTAPVVSGNNVVQNIRQVQGTPRRTASGSVI